MFVLMNVILAFAFCFVNIIFQFKYLHIYQLKDYSNSRYFKFILKKQAIFVIFCVIFIIFNLIFKNEILFLLSACFILMLNPIFNFNLITSKKTPIKFTPKFKRLVVISILLIVVCCFVPFGILFVSLLTIFNPMIAKALNIVDTIKNHKFISRAKSKLRLNKTKIIAITGSNGKTSVKNILLKMLSAKYNTLASPKSYNTPLGISKFINDELKEDCEFLILEYGARKKGDIKKLCKLFGADYGIITTIAPQHLETFKSVENVFKEKGELARFLNNNLCVFNLDNLYTLRMYGEKVGAKSGASIYSRADVYADNIKIIDFKTNFDLHINDEIYNISTKLLGRHNVLNIALASALATKLGVENADILKAIESLDFTPHRLELIRSNINILDDSYNCSLISARESIWVLTHLTSKTENFEKNLKNFKNSTNFDKKMCNFSEKNQNFKKFLPKNKNFIKNPNEKIFEKTHQEEIENKTKINKKVICTPGIIEGGKFEYDINFKLGVLCGEADEIIIIGEHNKSAIYLGLKSVGFKDEKIVFCLSLENAKTYFKTLFAGDTLLLLNDLPDDYN